MSLAFRHVLDNVSCHARGWETKSEIRVSPIRHDKNILRKYVGPCGTRTVLLVEEGKCLPR